jgi:hypothetical protein
MSSYESIGTVVSDYVLLASSTRRTGVWRRRQYVGCFDGFLRAQQRQQHQRFGSRFSVS